MLCHYRVDWLNRCPCFDFVDGVGIMIKFKRKTQTAIIPVRSTEGAAGFDLYYDGDSLELFPGQRHMFLTGIAVGLPEGSKAKIMPRSGWAYKYGIDVLAGLIDEDYTGEIKVILINHGDRSLHINHQDRIAQLVVSRYIKDSIEVDRLDDTDRGAGGFGSTGVR